MGGCARSDAAHPRPATLQEFARLGIEDTPARTRLFDLWQATDWKLPEAQVLTLVPPSQRRCRQSLRSSGVTALGAGKADASQVPSLGSTQDSSSLRLRPCSAHSRAATEQLSSRSSGSRACRGVSLPGMHRLEAVDYIAEFKAACKHKYSDLIRAWRLLIDPGGLGRVSFSAFCNAARSFGFADVRQLWADLDANQSGFITLNEWDPIAFRSLLEFRELCYAHYGGLDLAFKLGMDMHGANKVNLSELEQFCTDREFAGDIHVLFKALDVDRHGFITLDELDFLGRWEGERFLRNQGGPRYDLGNARACNMSARTTSRRKRPPLQAIESGEINKTSRQHSARNATSVRWMYPRAG